MKNSGTGLFGGYTAREAEWLRVSLAVGRSGRFRTVVLERHLKKVRQAGVWHRMQFIGGVATEEACGYAALRLDEILREFSQGVERIYGSRLPAGIEALLD